jgi:8-oxo-dGTP pyrophosphatase MutT (NUDIX family)
MRRLPEGHSLAKVSLAMADDATEPFMRHLRGCQNAVLPGNRLPFRIGRDAVGWLQPRIVAPLLQVAGLDADADGGVTLPAARAAELPAIAEALGRDGHYHLRREAFDVRAGDETPPISTIDRGAVPSFGITSRGVHCNGLVRKPGGLHLWVARRAADKLLDPGKLDHIVAGGISAGMDAEDTLIKEAGEEAAVPLALASRARHVARVRYAMERAEGLRRDLLYCYDLDLPEDFTPRPSDGEVEAFELWPIRRAVEAVRDGDSFKFNVNLVLIDLFLREGLIDPPQGAAALRRALDRNVSD